MEGQRWQRIRQLLEEALEKPDAERASFLEAACGSDDSLHREVMSLLASTEAASKFIEEPPGWLAAQVRTLESGTQIEHYRIVSLLGRGGMGNVYLAEDQELGRRVALKFLPDDVAGDGERLRRFEQEARAASALNHPNIVTIHEIRRGPPTPFLVTEYIDGQTLRQQVDGGRLDLRTAIDEAIQIAEALAAAHRAGITHRDLKPENVMVRRDGLVKVLDFGLARLNALDAPVASAESPARELTNPGTVMGTASYMSPEQARGLPAGTPSDLFSFGALLYELVTGSRPFAGVNTIDVLASVLARDPRPIKELRPDAPDGLQPIVDKLLCKDVAGRYASADAVLADLKALRREMDVSSSPRAQLLTAFSWTRAAVAALVAIVLIAGVVLYTVFKPAASLSNKDFILLSDFSNQTGDAAFDDVLEQALAAELDQSPFLSTFPESRVAEALRIVNGADDRRMSRESARETARRLGIAAVLAGSISTGRNGYTIDLEAIKSANGSVMARVRHDAQRKDQVLAAVGTTATDMRRKLGEPASTIQRFNVPIERETTSSLEALKAFSLGRAASARGHAAEAIAFHRRAVDLDPNFVLAWSQLANLYGATERARKEAAAATAFELRDRVGERQRFLIIGDYHTFVTREIPKAIQVYEQWHQAYPRDIVAAAKLGNRYVSVGLYEAAVEQLQMVVALEPRGPAALQNLARALLRLNRFAEAESVLRTAQQEKLETSQTRQAAFDLAFIRGDTASMQRAIVAARGQEDEYHRTFDAGEIALFAGRFRQAQGLFRRAAELAVLYKMPALWEGRARTGIGLAQAALGQCQDAKLEALKEAPLAGTRPAIWILAQCGEIALAQELYDQTSRATEDDVVTREVRVPAIQAILLLRSHHPERVSQVMVRSPYEAAEIYAPEPSSFAPSWLRGQAFLDMKNGAAAAAQFQQIIDHRGWAPKSSLWPLAHLGLARALTMTGARDEARKRHEQFFELWKDADPDAPALVEARREFAALSQRH